MFFPILLYKGRNSTSRLQCKAPCRYRFGKRRRKVESVQIIEKVVFCLLKSLSDARVARVFAA